MESNRVLRLHKPGDLRLHEEPLPIPTNGEVLVQVTVVSICGSDLHWFSEGGIGALKIRETPVILGHELAGIIISGEKRGQRVAIDPSIPCGECEFCLEGNPNFCTAHSFAGDGITDGGLREVMTWPERCLYPLPDAISDAEGAVLEALGVALHSVDLGYLRPGGSVGVFGCGPIGLLIIQLARLCGATQIIATDRLPQRLEAARACGADYAFPVDGGERDKILAATAGRGVNTAFEAAGENDAVETAVIAARAGGRVILVGIPADDSTSFTASTARRKGLTIKMCRRMKHTYPRAIALVEQGKIDIKSLITHRYPFGEAAQAFKEAEKRRGLKVVIEL